MEEKMIYTIAIRTLENKKTQLIQIQNEYDKITKEIAKYGIMTVPEHDFQIYTILETYIEAIQRRIKNNIKNLEKAKN